MQNVWLHFKACLNFAHTLLARIVSSFLPLFPPARSPAGGVFVTSPPEVTGQA